MVLSVIASSGISSSAKSFFQLIGVLLIFIFVLALTYFCTRWIAKYQQGMNGNKNIHVIETFRLTNNKFIQIIEVGGKYMVIAVCKDTVTMLCEIEQEELSWIPSESGRSPAGNESFQELFQRLKDKIPRK